MKYYAASDGAEHEVELTEDGIRLDGHPVRAELARVPGSEERHLLLGGHGYLFTASRTDGGWVIELRGRRTVVSVEDERARAIRELAGTPMHDSGRRELRAPMPGMVVRVLVEPGQRVEAGTSLIVVEAMKMENEFKADAPGTVVSVEVEEGETVNQSDLMVTFEA